MDGWMDGWTDRPTDHNEDGATQHRPGCRHATSRHGTKRHFALRCVASRCVALRHVTSRHVALRHDRDSQYRKAIQMLDSLERIRTRDRTRGPTTVRLSNDIDDIDIDDIDIDDAAESPLSCRSTRCRRTWRRSSRLALRSSTPYLFLRHVRVLGCSCSVVRSPVVADRCVCVCLCVCLRPPTTAPPKSIGLPCPRDCCCCCSCCCWEQ
mmetsp:Transcript_19343/g.44858  ORF Transcript_19343/g.44858 Transcript_19343/m.44858 type:complete len:209 (-) Transcript_19343:796-1422(-)